MMFDVLALSKYAMPAIQIILILALFWVAGLFLVLDKKLNNMRQGTDGIRNTIVELNQAIERAQTAIVALKTNSHIANEELAKKIDEANATVETLKFLSTAAKAVNSAPNRNLDNQLKTDSQYNGRRRTSLDDLPLPDPVKRNIWGGLR